MRAGSRTNRFTLMPLIALAGLSLAVTLPALSATQLHAAMPVSYANVTVRSGDTLWSLAERVTPNGGDVQSSVDAIVSANHLSNTAVHPGQHLRLPR